MKKSNCKIFLLFFLGFTASGQSIKLSGAGLNTGVSYQGSALTATLIMETDVEKDPWSFYLGFSALMHDGFTVTGTNFGAKLGAQHTWFASTWLKPVAGFQLSQMYITEGGVVSEIYPFYGVMAQMGRFRLTNRIGVGGYFHDFENAITQERENRHGYTVYVGLELSYRFRE